MIYVRKPTTEETQELQRMMRQDVGRVSQRAHMVLLSTQQQTVPAIAQLFQVCCPTVRYWLKQFNTFGPTGLYDQPRSGRPQKITSGVKEKLLEFLQADPNQQGYLATFWTVAMLVLALTEKLQVVLSMSAVRTTLHALGLRWGRPRWAMPDKVDPDKAQKQWAIAKAVVESPPETAILYADESRIELLPLIRAMWHWVGQQIRIPTPGSNESRALFGALSIRTGAWTYLVQEKMRKENFLAFLEHLLQTFPQVPIILIVDNYSSHTAHVVRDWLATHPRLQLYYLPKYCSHLNPVENIWLRLKNKIAANRLYASMPLLLQCTEAFFKAMTPEQALVWAAAEK
jgi:transposase